MENRLPARLFVRYGRSVFTVAAGGREPRDLRDVQMIPTLPATRPAIVSDPELGAKHLAISIAHRAIVNLHRILRSDGIMFPVFRCL